MSDEWPDNPEGFPTCPRCDEFVAVDESNPDYYICDACGHRYRFGLSYLPLNLPPRKQKLGDNTVGGE